MAGPRAAPHMRRRLAQGRSHSHHHTLTWQRDLYAAPRHEAADVVSVGALLHVPDHRLADRIAGIVDDSLRWNPSPFSFDRHPIAIRPHVVVGAMAVGDIAAGNAVRAADAFEPGPYIIGNIFVLTIIESRCGLRQARQGSNQ